MKYILTSTSSNFGNMFSVAGAALFLPFLPMLPVQILLNNLLYDFSQSTITTDRVRRRIRYPPEALGYRIYQKFMAAFGPVSSIFDYITSSPCSYSSFYRCAFALLGNDIEARGCSRRHGSSNLMLPSARSVCLRTSRAPFWKSKPSKFLT
jgi:Mg2+-importing ATPase